MCVAEVTKRWFGPRIGRKSKGERLTVLLDFGKVAALMRTHTCTWLQASESRGSAPQEVSTVQRHES